MASGRKTNTLGSYFRARTPERVEEPHGSTNIIVDDVTERIRQTRGSTQKRTVMSRMAEQQRHVARAAMRGKGKERMVTDTVDLTDRLFTRERQPTELTSRTYSTEGKQPSKTRRRIEYQRKRLGARGKTSMVATKTQQQFHDKLVQRLYATTEERHTKSAHTMSREESDRPFDTPRSAISPNLHDEISRGSSRRSSTSSSSLSAAERHAIQDLERSYSIRGDWWSGHSRSGSSTPPFSRNPRVHFRSINPRDKILLMLLIKRRNNILHKKRKRRRRRRADSPSVTRS